MPRESLPDEATDRVILLDALGRLPLAQRKAVVARFVLGFSTHESADLLGVRPGALRALLHRAVTTLRLDPSLSEKEH